jgi:hypothetical protein
MNVKELLAQSQYGVKPFPPYNEVHVEIRERYRPDNYILTEEEAVERFGDRHVWLAFHDEGTFDDPINGEHVYAICVD